MGKTTLPYDESWASAIGQAALPIATFSVTPHSMLSPGDSAAPPGSAGLLR